MKRFSTYLALSIILLSSCGDNDLENFDGVSEFNFDIEQAKLDVQNSVNDKVDLGDYYLVENDIMIPKNNRENKEIHIGKRHFYTSAISVPIFGKRVVNIYWDRTGFPPDGPFGPTTVNTWGHGISNAIIAYNERIRDFRIEFKQVYSQSLADITVKSDNGVLPNTTVASAGFPSNGNPYPTILINLDFLNSFSLVQAQMRYNMMHELGHCIGFRHTNLRIRGETTSNANPISATPNAEDPNSVFNGGTALNSNDWSVFDKIALETLY